MSGHRAVAVFVHGGFSGSATWEPLLARLRADIRVARHYNLLTFGYDTPRVRWSVTRRIPRLTDVADQLRTWINSHDVARSAPCLVLVGHSLGGLVIQRFIADALISGRGKELERIRGVVLIATPNTGSQLLLTARRLAGSWRLWRHPQERAARPFDDELETIRRIILEQCVYALGVTESHCKIRFDVYAGASDGVVSSTSARWVFPRAGTLPGDHHSVLKPSGDNSEIVRVVGEALHRARRTFPCDGVHIYTEFLDLTNAVDVAAVIQLQHDRFPPSAHMFGEDLQRALDSYENQWGLRMNIIVARVNGVISGFTLFSETEHALCVGYLVARKGVIRDWITQKLVEQLKRRSRELGDLPVVFEARDPDTPGAERRRDRARIKIFERLGARVIEGVYFLAPDMYRFPNPGAEEPYLLMYGKPGTMPSRLQHDEVRRLVTAFYNAAYRLWFAHRINDIEAETYFGSLVDSVMSSAPQTSRLGRI
jgi:pimeloyl-ACP methyl ester carboxylesterase